MINDTSMGEMTQESKDVFTASKKSNARIFNATKNTSPEIHQSLVRLQQDYIDAWKTVINSAISLEKEYANKVGFLPKVSESSLQIINEMAEMSIQAYLKQNKFIFDTVGTTEQAFATFNDTTKSFTLINKEIMEFLMSKYGMKLKA